MIYTGGVEEVGGRVVNRVSNLVEAELSERLWAIELFTSSVDHNEYHLNNALKRDIKFKEELRCYLEKADKDHEKPLVVFYERDAQTFLAGCRYCYEDISSEILRGGKYLALIRDKMELSENGSKRDALCLTLFRISEVSK